MSTMGDRAWPWRRSRTPSRRDVPAASLSASAFPRGRGMTIPPLRRRLSSRVLARTLLSVVAAVVTALAVGAIPAASALASMASVVTSERREPPDVRGLTLPEASTRIQDEWYPDYTPTIELDPEIPDQVPPETARVVDQTVVLYIEDNKDDVGEEAVIRLTPGSAVADLVGRTRDEAEAPLDALGLLLEPSGEGRVTTQDPAAGTVVPFGTTVVARLEPPPTPGPLVPRLLGLTEAEARAAVEGLNLDLVVGSATGDGERRVSEQNPTAGTLIGRNRAITVTLTGSTTPEPDPMVAVPDVTGLEAAAVQRVLEAAGLTLAVDPTGSETGAGALSFRQDPEPGSQVAPGTQVAVAFAVVDEQSPVAWWVWPTSAAVLALLLLALWSLRLSRRARPRRPDPTPTPRHDAARRTDDRPRPAVRRYRCRPGRRTRPRLRWAAERQPPRQDRR